MTPFSHYLTCAGLELHCTEWGLPADPVVVAWHGLARTGRDMDALAMHLVGQGYRVICPDTVGRGLSQWATDPVQQYQLSFYAAQARDLFDQLGIERAHWVGTSMGGIIGMLLASQARTPITRLVLNDVGPVITSISLQRIAQYVGRAPVFPTMDAAEAWIREVAASFGALTDAQWRHLTVHSVRPVDGAQGGFAMVYDPGLGDVFRAAPILEDIDLWPVYEAVRCPTLALRGADSDLLEAATLGAMAARGPCARTVEFAGVGHAPMLMDPAQIAVVRDFLLAR